MRRRFLLAAALLLAPPLFQSARAQTIALAEEDATVWALDQVVRGTLAGAATGTLYVNGAPRTVTASGDAFSLPLRLADMQTTIVACASAGGGEVCPDTLRWTLGYRPRPEAELRAAVDGRTVTLRGRVLDNPLGASLAFAFTADEANPQAITLAVADDSTASFTLPDGAAAGEYYVDWTVTAGDDRRRARTFVTVGPDGGLTPFVMETDHAAWVDRATVYQITPHHFTIPLGGTFRRIQDRLPEIVALGVNTIWLQPITPTVEEDQGYAVIDYFGIWDELGDADDLHALIDAAHAAGLRVMFDLVPNHTALQHPYAQDAIEHGERSHYYDFYQREFDDAPYSSNYNYLDVGQMRFVYYFWDELVNLNYDSPEVQRHLVEASRYWIEQFDVDGYRVDVSWGVEARNPAFVQEWRLALKRVKPEVFLLAESKATDEAVFERFDAAYDWTANLGYISEWAWQRSSQTSTLFNSGAESLRAAYLRNALSDYGRGFQPDAVVFRYLENNDTPRFRHSHSVAQTKMAATLLFSLHGIPMMYFGQEAGASNGQYSYPVYSPIRTIASYDQHGFFPHYRHLLRLRDAFPALRARTFAEIPVSPGTVGGKTFAYHRWAGDEHVVGVINLGVSAVDATLALPVGAMGIDPDATYVVTDLLTGDAVEALGAALAAYTVGVPGHTTRLFAVADSAVAVPVSTEPAGPPIAGALTLEPAAPNPFAARTLLAFHVPQAGPVRLAVYDVLGREVAVLVDGDVAAGRHSVPFDAAGLASGLYLGRLEQSGRVATRTMLLAR